MSLIKQMFKNLPDSFKELIKNKYRVEFLNAIKTTINLDGTAKPNIVPDLVDTLNAFVCYDYVKVVLIGQDPYPNKNAHGYAFSSLHSIPPSILNIYKCLLNYELISEMPSHANLTSWATQGVLLLNAALTTINGKSGAHMDSWETFTTSIIMDLDKPDIVFILLGDFAIKFGSAISKAKVLTWGHPSPLSRLNQTDNPKNFKYASVFADANKYLMSRNISPIDWDSVNNG